MPSTPAKHVFSKQRLVWFVSAVVVIGIALLVRSGEGDREAAARGQQEQPREATPAASEQLPKVAKPQHDVMAFVNGTDISRKDLTNACVSRHGKDVLESLVNKRLIATHCRKRGITVTQQEIAAEIDRMAKRFKLGREQWLELLESERGVSAEEYARDIIWPTLAMRKLAEGELAVSPEEIDLQIERLYGPAVSVRLIAVSSREVAEKLRAEVAADPTRFARLAIEHSEDINSASLGGLIQPIRRHVGDPAIEQAAFALQKGQVSAVIPVADKFILLLCEEQLPARPVNRQLLAKQIEESVKEEKLRDVAQEKFAELQSSATVVNVYNNPELRETLPGVVATINGDAITIRELGEECLLRYGEEVLETEISHLLLRQSLKKAGLSVTDADLDAEVRHAAQLAGLEGADTDAKLNEWFDTVTREEGITKQQYVQDAVWPSAALKKLTAEDVQVTEEDIQKGFEANFGPRVRCRAIVLGNLRRAQEVWDKARRNTSVEFFGDLAAEYSVEPTSKALRGEVPPIRHFGGQPQLEDAAFALQPGQLSGIVQITDKFIILRCEGRTEPIEVSLADVRQSLVRDIFEKKLRLAMSRKFDELRENSRIDNYLAGTSHAPHKKGHPRQPRIRRPPHRGTEIDRITGSGWIYRIRRKRER